MTGLPIQFSDQSHQLRQWYILKIWTLCILKAINIRSSIKILDACSTDCLFIGKQRTCIGRCVVATREATAAFTGEAIHKNGSTLGERKRCLFRGRLLRWLVPFLIADKGTLQYMLSWATRIHLEAFSIIYELQSSETFRNHILVFNTILEMYAFFNQILKYPVKSHAQLAYRICTLLILIKEKHDYGNTDFISFFKNILYLA